MNPIRTAPLLYYCILFLLVCSSGLGNSQFEWTISTVAESLHLFTNEIFRIVEHTDKTTNFVISPLSLFAALSLTSIGAKGSTLSQIQQTLRLSPNSLTRKGGMAHIIASMAAQNGEEVVIDLANFLWVPRGLAVKAEYARSVQEIFQTRVRDADFTRVEEVRHVINHRISNITRGHITDLFPKGSITKQTRLLLANAFYFKGFWVHAFNQSDTYMERFFMSNGKSIVVRMMHGSSTFQAGVLDNLGAKAILLPYQGNRYGLLCVLPDRNKELSELESDMINYGYTPTILLRKMIQRDVNITLPKFNIQFDMEMTSTLQKMGIRNLFTNEADLSGMSSSSRSAMLKVSNIYHQSNIEVNEGGTEASAASGLEITPLTGGFGKNFGPIEFRADRPFIFYLIDRENNNIPLIIGRVYNPLQSHNTNFNQYQDSVEQTMMKTERPGPVIKVRPEFQPTFNTHPLPQFIQEDDQVIYPQKPSYFNYYKSVKQTENRYFSHPPLTKRLHTTPVIFQEENFDGLRWKREFDNSTTVADSIPSTTATSTLKNEDVDTRLKDPLWFNKPTAPEVIIPLNTPESNRRPVDTSRPTIVRPQLISTPESVTNQPPLSSTIPPNIFFTLPTAPNPSQTVPVNQVVNNPWNPNEQNIAGAPGYAPSNNDMTFLNNRPVFISPSWYPSQTNPYFQPYPSGSGSELQGIFFPEYRFSSPN